MDFLTKYVSQNNSFKFATGTKCFKNIFFNIIYKRSYFLSGFFKHLHFDTFYEN